MKERAKALLRKNKNELPAARTLYLSLDRADIVIEGGPASEFPGAAALGVLCKGCVFLTFLPPALDGFPCP